MFNSPPVTLGLTGGARAWLELELEHDVLSWGEVLRGSLVLEGGWNRHWITEPLLADLFYLDEGASREVGSVQLTPDSHLIHPRTMERLPFRFRIPEDVPFQQPLKLGVDVRSGLWRQVLSVQLQVAPPPRYLAIAWNLMDLTGTGVRYWSLIAKGTIVAHLQAASPEAWFTGGRLELSRPRAPWRGRLLIASETPRPRDRRDDWIELPPLLEEPQLLRKQLEQLLRGRGYRPRSARSLPLPVEQPNRANAELPIPTHEEGLVTLD